METAGDRLVGLDDRRGVIGAGASEDGPPLRIVDVKIVACPDDIRKRLLEGGRRHGRVHQPDALAHEPGNQVGVGIELVIEVLVEASLGDSGWAGDAIDGGSRIGVRRELLLEGVHETSALGLGEIEEGLLGHERLHMTHQSYDRRVTL